MLTVDDSKDAPLEVSYQSNKNKSKQNLDNSQTAQNAIITTDVKTPVSTKKNKKNKKDFNNTQVIEDTGWYTGGLKFIMIITKQFLLNLNSTQLYMFIVLEYFIIF